MAGSSSGKAYRSGKANRSDSAYRSGSAYRDAGRDNARRPRLADVAALAGVSSSTASRALTANGYAAADVRQRVAAAAEKLGYVPDANARGLKAQATRTVGLLISDLRNSFYAEVAAGAASVLRKQDYTIVLVDDAASDREEMAAARTFLATRVAGVLLTPLSATVTRFVSKHGLPVVEIDRQFARGLCDAVLINNVKAAYELTRHLISLGHRRIALVIDETDWTTGKGRLRGYVRALEEAGLELDDDLVLRCGLDLNEVSDQAKAVLTSRRRPTAVFTANNLLAEIVWRQAQELQLSIPRGSVVRRIRRRALDEHGRARHHDNPPAGVRTRQSGGGPAAFPHRQTRQAAYGVARFGVGRAWFGRAAAAPAACGRRTLTPESTRSTVGWQRFHPNDATHFL